MAQINVNIQAVRNANYILPPLVYRMEHCERALAVLRWRIDINSTDSKNIKEELTIVNKEIEIIKEKIETLYKMTNSCMEQYMLAENQLEKKATDFI